MTLILLAVALLVWAIVLFVAGYLLSFWVKRPWIRTLVGVVAVSALFTLPFRDEIRGAEEFEALCKAGGVYQISPAASGKKFDLLYSSTPFKQLAGYTRPIKEATFTYADATSGEVIASAKAYVAGGGWLVQKKLFALTSTDGPLLGRSQCFPPDSEEVRRQQITNRVLN
jgi:hypothetical protein